MKYKTRRPRGHTLVEVVIAMLLIAIMTTLVLPTFLTGRISAGRSERRDAAADAVHRLSEELKNYVTADRSLVNGSGTGPDGWSLPGDRSGNWALAPGLHDLDPAVWAAPLAPYQGALSYTVAVRATPSGPEPRVNFRVNWQEP
jgi:prepilin-type N-terminal cleavage/methylation domain-containing protein